MPTYCKVLEREKFSKPSVFIEVIIIIIYVNYLLLLLINLLIVSLFVIFPTKAAHEASIVTAG